MVFTHHVPLEGVALDLCTSGPSLSALGGGLVDGCLVKTMSGFGLATMALGRHASAACRRVPLPCRGGGRRYLCCLLVLLDTSSPWSTGAMTALADALPPISVLALSLADACPPILLLLWRMLCRPDALPCGCFAAPCSSGCLDVVVVLLLGRLRRMLFHCGCAALWSSLTVALSS
jgi:hypothetical protein